MDVEIISFGYLHNDTPEANTTQDLRGLMYDPHRSSAQRKMTGLAQDVRESVLAAKNATAILDALVQLALSTWMPEKKQTFAIGCAGGKHRSVVVAEEMARRLRLSGLNVTVAHRHIHLPVVHHTPEDVPLTARQQQVLAVVRAWFIRFGSPPKLRDISEAVGLHTSSVHQQVNALRGKGYLHRDANSPHKIGMPTEMLDETPPEDPFARFRPIEEVLAEVAEMPVDELLRVQAAVSVSIALRDAEDL